MLTPILIADLSHPAVIITLSLASVSLAVLLLFGPLLYLGRTWRIVKMRGLIHLQFLFWAMAFVAAYNIILVLAGLYQWPFYVAWTVISLRRWAFVFAIFSLLTFQVILASIRNLAGQAQCWPWLRWLPRLFETESKPDQGEELQFLLRRCVLVATVGYSPVFIVGMTIPIFPDSLQQGYLAIYIVAFLIFVAVIITTHGYLIFTQHIPRYYSHRFSHLIMLFWTDLLIVAWIVYWAVLGDAFDSDGLSQIQPNGLFLLSEANFDMLVVLIWLLVYGSPAVAAIGLATMGYPTWRDNYENFLADQREFKSNLAEIRVSAELTRTLGGSPYSDSFETVVETKLLDVIMTTLSGQKLLALV